jgi:hypothetical protein
MINENYNIVLSTLRYKSSPELSYSVPIPFKQNGKEIIEFDRSINVDLEEVYDQERQRSDIFRPSCKFLLLFKNGISGTANYEPFENNLYYLNSEFLANLQCLLGTTVPWSGLPQYNEFAFIRTDYNVPGYTQPPNEHIIFQPQSASTYNWNFFVSYPFENDYETSMDMTFITNNNQEETKQWKVKNGIPFIITNGELISFRCQVKHGLSVGEFVKLYNLNGNPILYNNEEVILQVYSLGNGAQDSDLYIFNIYNIGFTGNTFNTDTFGTFKRVILNENQEDTISEYYVRKHKILTNVNDAIMVNAGFEQNIFGLSKKYESSGYTPNAVARVSIKEGSQSYTLSFNSDIHINPLRDNQKRPLSELFMTVIWKGYFGWTLGERIDGVKFRLKKGWDFNLPLKSNNRPQDWWSQNNSNSNTDFNLGQYTTSLGIGSNGNPINFTYVESLKEGDVLDGDFCEWNNYEQNERVISNIYHKFTYNSRTFSVPSPSSINQLGYYYQPLHPIKIREYSDYIETGNPAEVVDVPDYSYFSTALNQFVWRDLYSYGFIDGNGRGVNYPYLNGAHYPFENIIFRIIPEGTNYTEQTIIPEPITDNCE